MALTAIVAGNRAVITDVNQLVNLLTGVTGSGTTITLINNAESLIFQPSSDPSAGTRVWTVKNNAGTVLASMRFDGLLKLLAAAAAPATPVTGSLYWDTVLGLQVYNGAAWDTVSSSSAVVPTQPNLVLNSDFSRRTVFGLAMPEVFADLSGTTKIDGGAAGSVASNIFTQGAANNEYAWCAGSFVWRDGRASATFKAVSASGTYRLRWRIDANNWVEVAQNVGGANQFELRKNIAGTPTLVFGGGSTLTVNRWYWFEIEKQGTTFHVRLYDTGGTTPGVTKASSTLLTSTTQTVADAGVQVGAHISVISDQAAAQWGGIATGNGGVYVETWLPESLSYTFTGGGMAIGLDESADSGPIGKQWALRAYVPATSRNLIIQGDTPDGSVAPSVAYAGSAYMKTSGKGGSGDLITVTFSGRASALGSSSTIAGLSDAGETSWTRKTGTTATASTSRRARMDLRFNTASTATGTAYFMLPLLEQGSAATSWRAAPADDAPIVWCLSTPTQPTFTSTSLIEADPRSLAGNLFLPWDATLKMDVTLGWQNNSAATNVQGGDITIDGTSGDAGTSGNGLLFTTTFITAAVALTTSASTLNPTSQVAAGKHRVALRVKTSAGTAQIAGPARLIVTATRGK